MKSSKNGTMSGSVITAVLAKMPLPLPSHLPDHLFSPLPYSSPPPLSPFPNSLYVLLSLFSFVGQVCLAVCTQCNLSVSTCVYERVFAPVSQSVCLSCQSVCPSLLSDLSVPVCSSSHSPLFSFIRSCAGMYGMSSCQTRRPIRTPTLLALGVVVQVRRNDGSA